MPDLALFGEQGSKAAQIRTRPGKGAAQTVQTDHRGSAAGPLLAMKKPSMLSRCRSAHKKLGRT